MAGTTDIELGIVKNDTPEKQIESVVKQANENFRIIANEDRTHVVNDDTGVPQLLIGYQQGGFENGNVGFKLSQRGIDVTTATKDQLVASSDFNMHKIIANGLVSAPARSSSITLDSTNIGYRYQTIIDTGLLSSSQALSGELFLRVYNSSTYGDYAGGGVFYDDGTNVVHYKALYFLDRSVGNGRIFVEFRLRRTAGSLSITPSNAPIPTSFYWEICNNTQTTTSGGGAGGTSGKFYFFDTTTVDSEGIVTSALSSSTVELASTWAYYPHFV